MLKYFLTYVNEGSIYYGLEISENLGDLSFHLLEIQRKKQELFIVSEESHATLKDAIGKLKKNASVFLVINTGQILTKISEPSKTISAEALVHNAFPNLDFNTFYYELTKTNENLLISISLKEYVNTFLNTLIALNVNVVNFSLGVSPITSVTEFLQDGKTKISNAQLVMIDNMIEKVFPALDKENQGTSTYDVNGIKVKNNFLLSFSGILKHFIGLDDSFSNFIDRTSDFKKEFRNKRYFTILLKSSLALILGALLINFLFFSYYLDQVETLQENLAVNNVNKNQLVKLKEDVREKEERIEAILSTSNSRATLVIDKIVQEIPLSIILSELEYQPLIKPLRDGKEVEVRQNTIILSGQARESKEYYTWVESLEKLPWIGHIETTDYDYENKNTSNFSLEIEIDEKRN